jgi:hypothetical protein
LPTWDSAYLIATETACGAATVVPVPVPVPVPTAERGTALAATTAAEDAGRGTDAGFAAWAAARRPRSRLSSRSSERLCSAGSRLLQPDVSSPVPSGCAASRTTVGAEPCSDVARPSTVIVPTEIAPTAVHRQIAHQPGLP